jgi:hypothetical protein
MNIPTATLTLTSEDIPSYYAEYALDLRDRIGNDWTRGQLPAVRLHAFTDGPFADAVSAVLLVEEFASANNFDATVTAGGLSAAESYVAVAPNGRHRVATVTSGTVDDVVSVTLAGDLDDVDTVPQEFRLFMRRRVPFNAPIRKIDTGPGLEFYYGATAAHTLVGDSVTVDLLNTDIADPWQCASFAGVIGGALGTDFTTADRLQFAVQAQGEGTVALYGTGTATGVAQSRMRPTREAFLPSAATALYCWNDAGRRTVSGGDYVWGLYPYRPMQRIHDHPAQYGYTST